jgi:hypothetical protein
MPRQGLPSLSITGMILLAWATFAVAPCVHSLESMKINKAELLQGFVRMPHELMQAGWPLKLDLYRYTPIQNVLEVYGKEGDVLELTPFLELMMNPNVLLFVSADCLNRLIQKESAQMVHAPSEAFSLAF